jgi:hypothetical protein
MKGTVRKTHSYVVSGALIVGFATASVLSAYAQEFCRAISVPIPSIRVWHLLTKEQAIRRWTGITLGSQFEQT